MASSKHYVIKIERAVNEIALDEDSSFEFEARLGAIVDKNTRQRIYLPVITECILDDVDFVTFESSVPLQSHKGFNALLNGEVEKGALEILPHLYH